VGYEFGDLFSFAKTGKYPTTPTTIQKTTKSLIQAEKNAIDSGLSSTERAKAIREIEARWGDEETRATMDELFKEEWKNQIRINATNEEKRRQDKIQLYWLIYGLLSTESLDAVKQHMMEKWAKCEADQDPLTLWQAIKHTHTAYSSGMSEIDEAKVRLNYSALKQYKNESLTTFKERLEIYLRSMESMSLTVPTDKQQAADFLCKLYDSFHNRRSIIDNTARLGGKFPTTIMSELTGEVAPTVSAPQKEEMAGKQIMMTMREDRITVNVLYAMSTGTNLLNALTENVTYHPKRRSLSPRKPLSL